jgi:hypothetical protein
VNRHLSLLFAVCLAFCLVLLTYTQSVSSCAALNTIGPHFATYDQFDGSVAFRIRNEGTEEVYITGFELVWPDPTHPEIGENSGRYHLRQVVQGSSVSDSSAWILWTSMAPDQDATGNTKTQIPYDIATDSGNPLEGTWQTRWHPLSGRQLYMAGFRWF